MEEKGGKRSGDTTAKLAGPSMVCVLEIFNSISYFGSKFIPNMTFYFVNRHGISLP